ncbi:MAG: hypothetical protein NUV56_04615 [Candidatus Uhrbacteria bacterium]|nr:hypothetical protein [Candidatus Uhrbacteria bacterium]
MAPVPPVVAFVRDLWFSVTDWFNRYIGWILVVIGAALCIFGIWAWCMSLLATSAF